MIYASELRARRLLARVGKRLRVYANSGSGLTLNDIRIGSTSMADEIRHELARPRRSNEEPDESPQPRTKT